MSYKEITAKRVTPISFLSLIGLRTCLTLANNNLYWQKMVKLGTFDACVCNNIHIREQLD